MNQAADVPFRDVGHGHSRPLAAQRWGAVVGGGALALYGLSRKSALGMVMAASGGAVAYYASRTDALQEPIARASILLNCSQQQAFQFWHDFEHFPLFMNHLDSVSKLDDRRSRWIAIGPTGARISWDTEIVNERQNESITWRSLPGSDVIVDGSVDFRNAPANRGTIVTAIFRYKPPAGKAGAAIAKLLGKDPNFMMRQDMRRMKCLIEAGEIPTVEGQSHGQRSVITGVARALNPDRPIRRSANIAEVVGAERRIS